jgi:hypothetical protein
MVIVHRQVVRPMNERRSTECDMRMRFSRSRVLYFCRMDKNLLAAPAFERWALGGLGRCAS